MSEDFKKAIGDGQKIFNITYRSKMQLGSLTVMIEKRFNKLQKTMWRLLLGIKIEDVDVKM